MERVNFEVPRSPRRLSLITEKSADERLSLRKSRALNGSESHRRSSSHFVEDRGQFRSPAKRSSSLVECLSRSKSCGKEQLENHEKLSDIAQLGTPHPFEEVLNLLKWSQSSISMAEWNSEVNSVADLQCFQGTDLDFKHDEIMTVP